MIKKYDGCSGGMSKAWRKLFGKAPPWEGCCDVHDQPYAKGGTFVERLFADIELLLCVAMPDKSKGTKGHPFWALAMFIAVRIGGVPWLPFPWRWNFEGRSYWYTDLFLPLIELAAYAWLSSWVLDLFL